MAFGAGCFLKGKFWVPFDDPHPRTHFYPTALTHISIVKISSPPRFIHQPEKWCLFPERTKTKDANFRPNEAQVFTLADAIAACQPLPVHCQPRGTFTRKLIHVDLSEDEDFQERGSLQVSWVL